MKHEELRNSGGPCVTVGHSTFHNFAQKKPRPSSRCVCKEQSYADHIIDQSVRRMNEEKEKKIAEEKMHEGLAKSLGVPEKTNRIDPDYYAAGGIQSFDVVTAKMTTDQLIGFCNGNAMKYLLRWQFKNDGIEQQIVDLKKCRWNLGKLIHTLERMQKAGVVSRRILPANIEKDYGPDADRD